MSGDHSPEYEHLIAALRAHASERHRQSVMRLGVPYDASIGVPLPAIRKTAQTVQRSTPLARELWHSGLHEARLLAALVFEPDSLTEAEATSLLGDVVSWDLCDHLCNNLFRFMDEADLLVSEWAGAESLYTRRAAFSLIASLATHKRHLPNELFDEWFALIEVASSDARPHVSKAVSWALREIGQYDETRRSFASALAQQLVESHDRARAKIGRDALRELERLVPVAGSRRLRPAKA